MGGLTLKLDRTKWGYSVFGVKGAGPLARFIGDDIEVTLRRIAPPTDDGRTCRTLAARHDVLYARAGAASGALRGVKAAYGIGKASLRGTRPQFAISLRSPIRTGSASRPGPPATPLNGRTPMT